MQQVLVVFNLSKSLKEVIIMLQKINNKLCTLIFCRLCNPTFSHISQNPDIQKIF